MSYNVTLFGIKFVLKPIAFTLPIGKGWDIYWYGIIIALGFLMAVIYATKNAKLFNLNADKMLDVALVTTPLAILCARIYYVIFDGKKLNGVGDFFGFSDGQGFSGLAIYGGVIGAFLVGGIMCKVFHLKITDMFDIAAIGFLIGQGIGRWGNFVNQEAYGTFTGSSFWGMQSERTVAELGEGLVHPCFLYESIWCLIGAFLLHRLAKKRHFSGEIILSYGVWYGMGRAVIELLRTDSLMLGGIKVSCLLSVLLALICLIAIIVIRKRISENSRSDDYVAVFDSVSDDDSKAQENPYNENTPTETE